mgnify:CR=1 FL=1
MERAQRLVSSIELLRGIAVEVDDTFEGVKPRLYAVQPPRMRDITDSDI